MADISKAYSWGVQTCNAPNVGYSQAYRNQQTVKGITYYDCSSFIWYALKAGGFDVASAYGQDYPFTTHNMGNVLTKLGFTTVNRFNELKPGDIGVVTGHTEMCYSGDVGKGVFMGAHSSNYPLAEQVSISSFESAGTRWDTIYRYGDGATGGYGASIYVVSAIAGNFWQESGINPGIWESLIPGAWTDLLRGYGLGQWTNTGGDIHGRLYRLYEYLTTNGYPMDSGNGQVEFLLYENYWTPQQEASQFATLDDFLHSDSTDLTLLTHAYNIGWEGIHDASWDARVTYAQKCYDYILTHANDSSITEWITGNRFLAEDERLNNAVMLFRYLSAGGGGGGSPGKTEKKMPLWMKIRYRL